MNSCTASLTPRPTVTVITVVLNDAKHIAETISSVVNQTYSRVEYIVVDGNSHDGTLDVIREYEHNIDCWVSERDAGIYNAMNKGIVLSTGEIVGFLNSGDTYRPQALETVADYVQAHRSELGDEYIVTGAMEKTDVDGEPLFIPRKGMRDLRRIHRAMPVSFPATFVSRIAYERGGSFDERFRICADYELVYRLFSRGVVIRYLETVLASMRMGGCSDQLSSVGRRSWEHFLIQKEYVGLSRGFARLLTYFAGTFPKTALKQGFPTLARRYYTLKKSKIGWRCYRT